MRLILAMVLAGACGALTSCAALPFGDETPDETPMTGVSADGAAAGDAAVRRAEPLVRLGTQSSIPVVSPTGATPAAATTRPASAALADGDRIGRRTGHLQPDGDAGWLFRFRPIADAPDLGSMTVLPGSILESMERVVTDAGAEGVLFGISGEVTKYRDRSYLIIRRAVVTAPEADHGR